MAEPHDELTASPGHVHPESIEVGEFHLDGDHLTASLRVMVCGRTEDLTVAVQSAAETGARGIAPKYTTFYALIRPAKTGRKKLSDAIRTALRAGISSAVRPSPREQNELQPSNSANTRSGVLQSHPSQVPEEQSR